MSGAPGLRIGALGLLSLCFLGSAAVRLLDAGPVIAQELAETRNPAGGEVGCTPADDVLLAAVTERSQQLEVRERALAERQALLDVAEAEIAEKRAALALAEEQLAATMAIADSAAEQDLQRLTAIYENVKPKRAAGIFESMDTSFAAGILARMSPATAGEILTLIDANRAYEISVLMAARNMGAGGPLPPENDG
ncbi:MotE family protein [Oceanibium sediminis]|uniref:MotE family protein n=1 Tax=Oceanibium sediminis TaxID=2026339 RepID=UPI000DD449A7|nr:hypothetical protein [Oceanibium sediminis]